MKNGTATPPFHFGDTAVISYNNSEATCSGGPAAFFGPENLPFDKPPVSKATSAHRGWTASLGCINSGGSYSRPSCFVGHFPAHLLCGTVQPLTRRNSSSSLRHCLRC
ncbi:hypothetical protein TRVL_07040 [Trypanosoma vivax]|nr:hypothetical protein TRVL_07040 [Trypanosoma vivax]